MFTRASRLLLCVWLCFLARAGFHAALLPLWEGFDEWAHVAYIQRLASGGGLLVPGQTRVSREVQASLRLNPLPDAPLSTSHYTHEQYWRLPAAERSQLRARLESLPREWAAVEAPDGELSYEVQQPPLYYALLAPVHKAAASLSLPVRVLVLRAATVLLASLLIPLVFAVARRATGSTELALAAAALAAAMPATVMTAARVGNDSLSMVFFAALLWLAAGSGKAAGPAHAVSTGVVLGAGLVTKAYFLTAVPALACLYAWNWTKGPGRRRSVALQAALAFSVAGTLACWWYWRNHQLTGNWSGLQQVAGQTSPTLTELVRQAQRVDWSNFFRIAFNTHIWTGNWSFLQLRSWMYDVFLWLFAAAAAGLVLRRLRRRNDAAQACFPLVAAGCLLAWFWVGLMYHEWTFWRLGFSSSAGWYSAAVASSEALLLICGWAALCPSRLLSYCFGGAAALFVLLDVYAANFLLAPFYTGMISRAPSGRLASFHLSQFGEGGLAAMLDRISGGTLAPATIAALWLLYLAGSAGLPVLASRGSKKQAAPGTTRSHRPS